jgi:hypothetical protein
LQKDVTKRLQIPQILAHPWFTSRTPTYEVESPLPSLASLPSLAPYKPSTQEDESRRNSGGNAPDSSEVSTQESLSPFMRQPDLISSTPTTPDESTSDPFDSTANLILSGGSLHRHPSNSTIRKTFASDLESLPSRLAKTADRQPTTVIEENGEDCTAPSPLLWSGPASAKAPPPPHPIRTPARTKRRSVSSILSDSGSPATDRASTPLPSLSGRESDFASLLSTPTPIIFSTPTERHLLNTLSTLGFDTAQIVHSVLTNACDAAGAVWWMLKKKEERYILEDNEASALAIQADSSSQDKEPNLDDKPSTSKKKRNKSSVGIQTDSESNTQAVPVTAPQFAFVPPTPTSARPVTPPRAASSTRSPMLSPSSSVLTGEITSLRSHPSTPVGSFRDKDREKDSGSKGRKARSGSVSIMQRATTALEAAGLVRKKSSEAVGREREKSRDLDTQMGSGDEPRLSHGSGSSKLSKSSSPKPAKDHPAPSTPPSSDQGHNVHIGSPWVLADKKDSFPQPQHPQPTPTAAHVHGEMLHSHSTPNFSETTARKAVEPPLRTRANLLTAFRLWFHEDRKGKRKVDPATSASPAGNYPRRRGSGSNGKFGPRGGNHRGRPSVSSRRSSSVNSRRSSAGASAQIIVVDSPQVHTRRSLGSHTPNSERGEFSSRPSSIRSVSRQPRHRRSPSRSSAGRTSSPMQKYHHRVGSGSSTRVARHAVARPHVRSNSAASSIHSPPSSRPTSFYEPSESELGPRSSSPMKPRTKRSTDDNSRSRSSSGSTNLIAQKRQGPFMSPIYGAPIGRSSWKKSWGIEPPGWQSRTAIEVLAISPPGECMSIRDVFSGKQSLCLGDESDWIDEDEDIPAFAGGLGQMGSMGSGPSGIVAQQNDAKPATVTLSPAPRGHRASKRTARNTGSSSGGVGNGAVRQKGGQSPAERASPLPPDTGYESLETRTGRRQLPTARSGPAFKHAIQEEDEEEE